MSVDETHSIPRRDIHFPLGERHDPDWFGGCPYMSAYCDGLSIFFPNGERFFVRSVAHYLPRLKSSPGLRDDIRGFMAQEAMHTREHEVYNERLRELGYPVDTMDKRVTDTVARVKGPLYQLALTVAAEHLTATLAHLVLRDGRVLSGASEGYRDLWTWHSLEEMEHKGVAFDVYRAVTADLSGWQRYALRCTTLILTTWHMHRLVMLNMRDILKTRGLFSPWRARRLIWSLLMLRPGYYRRSLGYYLAFFLPGFNPWKVGKERVAARPWQNYFNLRSKAGKNA